MKRIEDFGSQVYLINTGWTAGSGGADGKGNRFPIPVTRAVVAAAQSGALLNVETKHIDSLNLDFPVSIPGVADEYIDPKASWGDDDAYEEQAKKLASLFRGNIEKFEVSDDIVAAGPQL
jgi:phosphoenolpyruvate carboxykinase (ATP)